MILIPQKTKLYRKIYHTLATRVLDCFMPPRFDQEEGRYAFYIIDILLILKTMGIVADISSPRPDIHYIYCIRGGSAIPCEIDYYAPLWEQPLSFYKWLAGVLGVTI